MLISVCWDLDRNWTPIIYADLNLLMDMHTVAYYFQYIFIMF